MLGILLSIKDIKIFGKVFVFKELKRNVKIVYL